MAGERILIIDGEVVPHALARIPRAGETRGNLAVGGIFLVFFFQNGGCDIFSVKTVPQNGFFHISRMG